MAKSYPNQKIDSNGNTRIELDSSAVLTLDKDGSRRWLSTIHPYDLTEYHWAFSRDGRHWSVCRNNGRFGSDHRVEHKAALNESDPLKVLAAMRELDKALRAHIDLS